MFHPSQTSVVIRNQHQSTGVAGIDAIAQMIAEKVE
jgi:hypothetical protein